MVRFFFLCSTSTRPAQRTSTRELETGLGKISILNNYYCSGNSSYHSALFDQCTYHDFKIITASISFQLGSSIV